MKKIFVTHWMMRQSGLFERITDKYSRQFNLKYSTSSQLSLSQPELDTDERAEICVRTKVTELIDRLTCVFMGLLQW